MGIKDEITVAIDELQKGVRVLIDLPSRVTINTEEYQRFYDMSGDTTLMAPKSGWRLIGG